MLRLASFIYRKNPSFNNDVAKCFRIHEYAHRDQIRTGLFRKESQAWFRNIRVCYWQLQMYYTRSLIKVVQLALKWDDVLFYGRLVSSITDFPAVLGTYWSWALSFRERWCPGHSGVNICRVRRAHDPFQVTFTVEFGLRVTPAVRPLAVFCRFCKCWGREADEDEPQNGRKRKMTTNNKHSTKRFRSDSIRKHMVEQHSSGGRRFKRCETTTNLPRRI
jgi:hypothetical protein